MKKECFFGFHKWGKIGFVPQDIMDARPIGSEQYRKCEKCGEVQTSKNWFNDIK